jgi:GTP-binding protein YchF
MEIGIVGLPNVGKSTLFNALTAAGAASSNYPFTTIDPNVGIVSVPDARLARLAEIYQPKKITPAVIKFVDIAGLVKGASKGEGLGNQFLANIREVDAIVHLVRLFQNEDVVHTMGGVDPLRDIEVIETELILADMQSLDKQVDKLGGQARSGDKEAKAKLEVTEQLKKVLNEGKCARESGIDPELMKPYFLLTAKPVLYVGNEDEKGRDEALVQKLKSLAEKKKAGWITICSKVEAELSEMTPEDRATFQKEMGITESGLDRLVKESYRLLNLITFLTGGPDEVRGWTVEKGGSAVDAAGKIHTDIAKGFIKADIFKFSDIDQLGSEKTIQEKGLKRSEGRDYIMQDGDVCYFHFRG